MRVHPQGSASMYKRVPSKDSTNSVDLENDSEVLQDGMVQESTDPPLRLSLPHVLVASIVSFLFGYHLGVVNEPLESIARDLGFSGNSLAEGLVVSTCLGGAFLGSLFSGLIADGVGRRRSFQLCALPMIIGACCSATSNNLTGMLIGRFLVGIGLGIGPPVASLYITEVSPPSVRGTYGSFIQISTCLGLMGALLIGIPVKSIQGWWRMCFWLSTIPSTVLALAMVFCAESPHWLYKIGNGRVLKSDRGDENDTVRISELLYGRHCRVVFIGSTLFALQQLSGINAVFYFSSTVFRSAGVSSNLANAFVGIVNLLGSIIALLLMDKLGRKVLLLWSFFGMAMSTVFQVIAAGLFASTSGALYLSVLGMLMFVFCFAIGVGPVPGLLLSEIFPNRIRAKAMAFCMSVHWVFNFMVGLLFLRLLEVMGPQLLYSMLGTFCLVRGGVCKTERDGNQRKNASRNRDSSSTTTIE
ncbi:hypothetical protein OSB04_015339 [Centaurea solstitialis]|uniref:Major facilitator superfamily (MFS) profile domain-containing protein n=1 Tax=Centaurea solstitialis TaxID=347529 RepID=A0AA38SYU5_9ASTR|nr:hypothetical protein OSB04_015339 [Centaurea solstitialis]